MHHKDSTLLQFGPKNSFASSRVMFAAEKPIFPPANTLNSAEDLEKLEKTAKDLAGEKGEPSTGNSRAKRFADALHKEPVCKSVSEWVERTTAEDIWGNTVVVLQKINVGGVLMDQYFYETFCEVEETTCTGIDTRQYNSVCSSQHVWAYAKVRTRDGEEGWAIIKVRGSCNCSLFKRSTTQETIVDLFSEMWSFMNVNASCAFLIETFNSIEMYYSNILSYIYGICQLLIVFISNI